MNDSPDIEALLPTEEEYADAITAFAYELPNSRVPKFNRSAGRNSLARLPLDYTDRTGQFGGAYCCPLGYVSILRSGDGNPEVDYRRLPGSGMQAIEYLNIPRVETMGEFVAASNNLWNIPGLESAIKIASKFIGRVDRLAFEYNETHLAGEFNPEEIRDQLALLGHKLFGFSPERLIARVEEMKRERES